MERSVDSILACDITIDRNKGDKRNKNKKGYDENDRDERRNDHNNDNNNRHNNDNRDHKNNNQPNHNNNGNNNSNNQNQRYNNPICKILYQTDKVFKRDDVFNLLIDEDGLMGIIDDLKSQSKSNDGKAQYVQRLLRDVVFASALPDAMSELFGKGYDENEVIPKKSIALLINEINIWLNSSYRDNNQKYYSDEILDSMRRNYTEILFQFNKKTYKKLLEKVKGMTKNEAKQIAILTACNSTQSVYQLTKYLYKRAESGDELFSISAKSLQKIFECIYRKNMDKAIKTLMLEKVPQLSDKALDVSINLNVMILNYLNSLSKGEIASIINSYIDDRVKMEKNGLVYRRFGDRRTIHPEDYAKLVKVLEDIESKDLSVIPYLRK